MAIISIKILKDIGYVGKISLKRRLKFEIFEKSGCKPSPEVAGGVKMMGLLCHYTFHRVL